MKYFKKTFLSMICFFLLMSISNAAELSIANFAQSELDSFSKQIGFLTARRQYRGANPLGIIGFSLGIEATAVKLDDSALWDKSFSNSSAPTYLAFPVAHIKKGLPLNIDVGVRGGTAPGADVSLIGGEICYAPLAGTLVTPAVNVFLSYSVLNGGKNFDLNSTTVGTSISKGFGPLTPYAGIGYDQTKMKVKDSLLSLESVSKPNLREFVGVRLNLLLLSLCAEANFGEMQSYGLSIDVGI